MYPIQEIKPSFFYVGVNDRNKHLFENLWPLPYGVSYNSYLLCDQKVALIDTVDIAFIDLYLQKIEAALQGRSIDYLVIHHMEPDHSGSIRQIRQRYPNIQIVGNARTLEMVAGFFSITDQTIEVKDGDTLSLGARELTFLLTPMVHWPETMMSLDSQEGILFSGDAFGCFGANDGAILDTHLTDEIWYPEMLRYYSNIVGKFGSPVQQALRKLKDQPISMICSTHGPIWQTQLSRVVSIYDQLSRYQAEPGVVIAYGSMYGHTEQLAEIIASTLADNGVDRVVVHNVSTTHPSYILRDIFRYQGLIVGSPTYNNQLYPPIASLLDKIESRGVKDRLFGAFGSYTWAGVAGKRLKAFADKLAFEQVGDSIDSKQAPTAQIIRETVDMARSFAQQLLFKQPK